MKKIFISTVSVFLCAALFAQQKPAKPYSFKDYMENPKNGIPYGTQPFIFKVPPKAKASVVTPSYPIAFARPSHTLPNGNKVYLLPQDNMPCIVPDMSQDKASVIKAPNNMDKRINGGDGKEIIPNNK